MLMKFLLEYDHSRIIKRNFQSLVQFFINAPPNFHYGLAIVSFAFLAGLSSAMRDLLAPTASDIFALRLWKLIGAPLVEPNIFIVIWSVVSLQQFIVYIQPSWGVVEILKYLGIVQLVSTLSIAILELICFITFQALNFFFYVPICGLPIVGVCALVSLKQFLPDTVVLTTLYGRLKNGHLPLTALCVALLLWLFGLLRGGVPLQIAFGIQISWTYLRFFRVCSPIFLTASAENDASADTLQIVGDESEHFTWASFFPRRTQPLANVVGNAAFRTLVALKICRRLKDLDLNRIGDALQSTWAASGVLDGLIVILFSQRALRVLNERLSRVVSVRPGETVGRMNASSPQLPSAALATVAQLRRDSSTDDTLEFIAKSAPQRDLNVAGHLTPPTSAELNAHFYGVASPATVLSQTPSRLLARLNSESTAAADMRQCVEGASDSEDEEEGELR